MQELYDRQKELAQLAIEELKRRRVGTETTIEALHEILQRQSEVREPERDTQRMQDVSQSSIASQREETPIRQVEVISVKRTKVEQEEKKPIMFKEAPMSCPIKPKTPGEPSIQVTTAAETEE